MAITLVCGEGSEQNFISKVQAWFNAPLTDAEKERALTLRSLGYAVNYAAFEIGERRKKNVSSKDAH